MERPPELGDTKRLMEYLLALVGRGHAEGAYKETVAGEEWAERVMQGAQELIDSGKLDNLDEFKLEA